MGKCGGPDVAVKKNTLNSIFPSKQKKNSSTQSWFSDLVKQIAQSTKKVVKMFWLYAHLLLTMSLLSRCTPLHLPRLVLT